MTGLEINANNSIIQPINSSNSNNYWSYPLQAQHSQMSINAEESANNNFNINTLIKYLENIYFSKK